MKRKSKIPFDPSLNKPSEAMMRLIKCDKTFTPQTIAAVDVLKKIQNLILRREVKYGGSWYNYGFDGNASHLKEKALRFMHQQKKRLPVIASIDTLQDMIVWAIFCMTCIELGGGVRPNFDPEKYKLQFTKEQLYGKMKELTADDHFVLTAKFFNEMYKRYCEKKPIEVGLLDDLVGSLLRMRTAIDPTCEGFKLEYQYNYEQKPRRKSCKKTSRKSR